MNYYLQNLSRMFDYLIVNEKNYKDLLLIKDSLSKHDRDILKIAQNLKNIIEKGEKLDVIKVNRRNYRKELEAEREKKETKITS